MEKSNFDILSLGCRNKMYWKYNAAIAFVRYAHVTRLRGADQRKFGSPKFRVTDVYISSQCQLKRRIAKAQDS